MDEEMQLLWGTDPIRLVACVFVCLFLVFVALLVGSALPFLFRAAFCFPFVLLQHAFKRTCNELDKAGGVVESSFVMIQ